MITSRWLLVFTKPPAEGYAAQLPPCIPSNPNVLWRRAFAGNREVERHFTPDARRYQEWYTKTYGVKDITDGSAASGASSNRKLDDRLNQEELQQWDLREVQADARAWEREYNFVSHWK